MKITAGLVALAATLLPAGAVVHPTPEWFREWFGKDISYAGSGSAWFSHFRREFLEVTSDKLSHFFKSYPLQEGVSFEASEYPYFNVFPQFVGAVGQTTRGVHVASWSAPCFQTNVATAKYAEDGSLLITISASQPVSMTCTDSYLLATTSSWDLVTIMTRGDHTVEWQVASDMTSSELWDMQNKGVRIFKFLNDIPTTVANLVETFKLFIPEIISTVPASIAELNVDFLESYTEFKMPARDDGLVVIPESQIHSGDFFGIIRLDGLDPMLAWGMGSTTGHTTIAQWIDGELYVLESTVVDSYWPTDGVQKTPYRKWVEQAHAADFQVVHVPLSEEARARFNEQAAVNFFNTVEGIEYGYQVMFWGWLDTVKENFPCLPPDYESNCFQWELVEPLFGLIDRAIPELASVFWVQAWNLRLGTSGLRTSDIYQEAAKRGMNSIDVPIIPEQDTWLYNTTRYGEPYVGKAMVCCVFVCNMWKAAGVFSDINNEVNCGELTNFDDYVLTILDDSYTQMMGKYLSLNQFHSKDPYSHMAEHCPSFPPDYEKPADC
jgi:hypothetical protein